MARFHQFNANRSRFAHDAAWELAMRSQADFILLSESNKKLAEEKGWIRNADVDINDALVEVSRVFPIVSVALRRDFVVVEIREVTLTVGYVSQNSGLEKYEGFIYEVVAEAGRWPSVIIAGDFNVKIESWGAVVTDRRVQILVEAAIGAGLYSLGDGLCPTLERGESASFIDVTFASKRACQRVGDWCILDEETLSYHNVVLFVYKALGSVASFTLGLRKVSERAMRVFRRTITDRLRHALMPDEVISIVQEALDELRMKCVVRNRSAYWWYEEVGELEESAPEQEGSCREY
ncbi:uncharacterized protein LOC142328374 [Lycorma delicatula]|uniref:uncharacterized protein LOC142328374 n=1 Tax=Lycorma delicatula TaxID=130591 RepID=UPI003F51934B